MFPNDLGLTADALIDQYGRPTLGATLLRLERHPVSGEISVRMRPLKRHPVDALRRFRAPASWIGLGLLTGGWAAPLDGTRPSAHPEAQRITQVVVVDRGGRVESRVRFPDGSIMREAPSVGAVLDAMRAALGPPDRQQPSRSS
jgi:hypothetical protein